MTERTQRLKRLMDLQGRIRDLHELRHANHLARAAAAAADADALAAHGAGDPETARYFPELYAKRITGAMVKAEAERALAAGEARRAAEEKARLDRIARNWRESEGADERAAGEKALEEQGQRPPRRP